MMQDLGTMPLGRLDALCDTIYSAMLAVIGEIIKAAVSKTSNSDWRDYQGGRFKDKQ